MDVVRPMLLLYKLFGKSRSLNILTGEMHILNPKMATMMLLRLVLTHLQVFSSALVLAGLLHSKVMLKDVNYEL